MIEPDINEQLKIIRRGAEEIIPEEELIRKLEKSIKNNQPLIVKEGFDPTAPDLHLGHMVSIRKLKQFQQLGHTVVFLIGDFTGMIGDPSGKNEMRKRMSKEEVQQNAETYKQRIFTVLDPDKTVIDFNSRWSIPLNFEDVLSLTSKYTVARMLERDDFKNRYTEGRPISIMEFLYPLAQAYDSVALKADIELGGTDQKFNLLVGRDIMREYGLEPQVILTLPLLVGLDGVEKMSKSLGNYIGINESANDMFGKTMSIADNMILTYFELVTDTPDQELPKIKGQLNDSSINPRDIKAQLAKEIVRIYHGQTAANNAEEEFNRVFREKFIPAEIPEYNYKSADGKLWIVRLMTSNNLASSNGDARRLIKQGAVSINGEKISDPDLEFTPSEEIIIKVGKRRFLKIKV